MQRSEIESNIAKETGFPKSYVHLIVTLILNNVIYGMERDGYVNLMGFGVFENKFPYVSRYDKPEGGYEIQFKRSKNIFSPNRALKRLLSQMPVHNTANRSSRRLSENSKSKREVQKQSCFDALAEIDSGKATFLPSYAFKTLDKIRAAHEQTPRN